MQSANYSRLRKARREQFVKIIKIIVTVCVCPNDLMKVTPCGRVSLTLRSRLAHPWLSCIWLSQLVKYRLYFDLVRVAVIDVIAHRNRHEMNWHGTSWHVHDMACKRLQMLIACQSGWGMCSLCIKLPRPDRAKVPRRENPIKLIAAGHLYSPWVSKCLHVGRTLCHSVAFSVHIPCPHTSFNVNTT